jgi:esterase/lipase
LHGSADTRAQLTEARQVYDAVPGPKWFKEFAGTGHAPTVDKHRREWKETVSQFLKDANVEVDQAASERAEFKK